MKTRIDKLCDRLDREWAQGEVGSDQWAGTAIEIIKTLAGEVGELTGRIEALEGLAGDAEPGTRAGVQAGVKLRSFTDTGYDPDNPVMYDLEWYRLPGETGDFSVLEIPPRVALETWITETNAWTSNQPNNYEALDAETGEIVYSISDCSQDPDSDNPDWGYCDHKVKSMEAGESVRDQ